MSKNAPTHAPAAAMLLNLHDQWTGGPITADLADATSVLRTTKSPYFATYYVLGVLFDGFGGGRAERAWSSPHVLRLRLGHLDWTKLAKSHASTLAAAVRGTTAGDEYGSRFRFSNKMGRWIKTMAGTIVEDYDGNPRNIWATTTSGGEIVRRFWSFDGIGQKRATMAANLLHREYGKEMSTHDIDISVDVLIRRVFLRSGLSASGATGAIVAAARLANPAYPGKLDSAAWEIGRKWCHATNPNCDGEGGGEACPLTDACNRNGM